MNKNMLRILIPIVAILVIAESIMLLTKQTSVSSFLKSETDNVVDKPTEMIVAPLTLSWDVSNIGLKLGTVAEVPLLITSDKDASIDAIDLYIKYDPTTVVVNEAVSGKGFVTPSFKKISADKGLVVMNFLVSEASGFKLKKGVTTEVVRLKVKYLKEGVVNFGLGDGTLVVENATAKVLPFNSNKLVINVSR